MNTALIVAVSVILFFILPLFIRLDGVFNIDKDSLLITLRLWNIKILTFRAVIAEDKLLFSINNKPPKKKKKPKNKKRMYAPEIDRHSFYVSNFEFRLYHGVEDVNDTTYGCAAVITVLNSAIALLSSADMINSWKIQALPCYTRKQTMARFSINVLTNTLKVLLMFVHTKKGGILWKTE